MPEAQLPEIRQDIELVDGPRSSSGRRSFTLYDPLRHRYFSIDETQASLLSLWCPVAADAFCTMATAEIGREVHESEVAEIVYFLQSNSLVTASPDQDPRHYIEQARAAASAPLRRAIHSYLFVRIPIVRPHEFLVRTCWLTTPFFWRSTWGVIGMLGIVGLYLTSRQWDAFTRTFLDFFSFKGLVYYGVSLVLIKVLHELGHAYTATRNGVRVATMGVAFMVMVPLLYTDVTNAWRLKSARKRLQITAAGLYVELLLACLATFLWVFLPDGPARSVAFVTATTSWLLSVAINLNPFMKFDGYHLLADGVGISNLQNRSFALARWQLREFLFDLREPPPDTFSRRGRAWLVAYAWSVWIYRLFLFLGIALLVYTLFFKLLGVTLFVIEIVWFVALPIFKEIFHWWKLRFAIMKRRRIFVSTAVLASVVALLFVPIRWSVVLPAVLEAEQVVAVHAPRQAQIASWYISAGAQVQANDVLAQLVVDDLTSDLHKARLSSALLQQRMDRTAGDARDLAARTTLTQEQRARAEEKRGLRRQLEELVVRAPISGVLRDVDRELHVGAWINRSHLLTRVVGGATTGVRAYGTEDVLWRLKVGEVGWFVPDDAGVDAVEVTLQEIEEAGTDTLSIRYLSSVYGGRVASERVDNDRLEPRQSQYVLRLIGDTPPPSTVVRGVVRLPGKPQSLASRMWGRVARVLVRESGV